jgi:hypothetical protein
VRGNSSFQESYAGQGEESCHPATPFVHMKRERGRCK